MTWDALAVAQKDIKDALHVLRTKHKEGYGRGAWSWIIADDAS